MVEDADDGPESVVEVRLEQELEERGPEELRYRREGERAAVNFSKSSLFDKRR